MEQRQYAGESPVIQMTKEEYDSELAKIRTEYEFKKAEASEKAYQMGFSDCQKKMQDKEAALEDLKHKYLLLQVRHDQLLRTTKELAQCLQYETGNGFIE